MAQGSKFWKILLTPFKTILMLCFFLSSSTISGRVMLETLGKILDHSSLDKNNILCSSIKELIWNGL